MTGRRGDLPENPQYAHNSRPTDAHTHLKPLPRLPHHTKQRSASFSLRRLILSCWSKSQTAVLLKRKSSWRQNRCWLPLKWRLLGRCLVVGADLRTKQATKELCRWWHPLLLKLSPPSTRSGPHSALFGQVIVMCILKTFYWMCLINQFTWWEHFSVWFYSFKSLSGFTVE